MFAMTHAAADSPASVTEDMQHWRAGRGQQEPRDGGDDVELKHEQFGSRPGKDDDAYFPGWNEVAASAATGPRSFLGRTQQPRRELRIVAILGFEFAQLGDKTERRLAIVRFG